MAHHIMIDLETLGTQPNAVLLSLGAVKFDLDSLEIVSTFYLPFRLSDQQAHGRSIDLDTVRWWMGQSNEAREVFESSQELTNEQVLTRFNEFCSEPERVEGVWGNGAAFDNVCLTSFYRAYNIKPAWNFRQDFCYRTFRKFFSNQITDAMEFKGTKHNAVDDAYFQTEVLLQMVSMCRQNERQSMMLGRLLAGMAGMLTDQVTAEDLMNVETEDGTVQDTGHDLQGVEEQGVSGPEGTEGDGA